MVFRHNANNNCGTRDCSLVNWDLWTGKGIKTVLSTFPTPLILDKYWWKDIFLLPGYTTPWLIISNFLNTGSQLGLGNDTTALAYQSDCQNYHKQVDQDDKMQLCLHNCYVHFHTWNSLIIYRVSPPLLSQGLSTALDRYDPLDETQCISNSAYLETTT